MICYHLALAYVISNTTGIVWINQWSQCNSDFVSGAWITLIGGWLMLLRFIISVWINFDPLGKLHHSDQRLGDKMKRLWKQRLACFCCSRNDQSNIAYQDVANFVTDIFGDTDLVSTDVCAAMILLANKEKQSLQEKVNMVRILHAKKVVLSVSRHFILCK